MHKSKISDLEFSIIVEESFSFAEVIKKCNLVPAGGNYQSIKNRITRLNLTTNHFTGKGWNVGARYRQIRPAQSLKELLVDNSTYQSFKLCKRLLKEGYKERKCEMCGNTHWYNNEIPLELHHINGVKTDNRIENLQLLCPNCHALTDNYRGKNIGMSAQKETFEVEAG
jgi:5-methylcytosine-specific restriction endonuclease McrA